MDLVTSGYFMYDLEGGYSTWRIKPAVCPSVKENMMAEPKSLDESRQDHSENTFLPPCQLHYKSPHGNVCRGIAGVLQETYARELQSLGGK